MCTCTCKVWVWREAFRCVSVHFFPVTCPRVCSIRCGPSCVTGPVSAPPQPPSARQECPWCRMAAGAARCVPGSWGSPAATGFPATAREACSATTVPVSLGGLANVSVRFTSVWAGPTLGPQGCNSMCLKSAQQSATGCRGEKHFDLCFKDLCWHFSCNDGCLGVIDCRY